MESVLGRYKNLIWLVAVLFLQVLGLAMQVKRGASAGQDTRLIRVWVVGAVSPLERGLVWIQNSAGDIWHNYFYLRGVRAENRQLREQIEQMRLEQVRLSEDAAQAHRLQKLLAFKEQFIAKTVAAQVIGSSGMDSSRVVYIDKGENVGIKRDMAVITADGIVGKVLLVYPTVSEVLLINDPTSGVGVLLGNSRLQGVLVGGANGEVTLNGVMSDEQVPMGENVVTSGGDQIFPKGLSVGVVSKVGQGKDLFLNIRIKPAANLSQLEEVLVLLEKQERQAVADDRLPVRAADVLAQRLPSVPDKPAASDPNAATGTVGASKPGSNSALGTAKPASNASTGLKPGATTTPPQTSKTAANGQASGSVSVRPAGTSPATAGTAKAVAKPTPSDAATVGTKPVAIQPEPAITQQKPQSPPPVQPDSPPPDPNRPQ